MALEIIKNIAEAERKGELIKSSRLQEAEQLMLDADGKCNEIITQAQNTAKLSSTKLIQEAIDSVQQNVTELLLKADEDCNKINELARKKMPEAVQAVIAKVVGIDGNS